jgi:glycosyltransferase involved in cell wall biosynthesis
MSKNGRDLMTKFKLDPLYVPHGIDTAVFRPQPELRDLIRDKMEIPRDAFLVGMVAANKSNPTIDRKSFAKAFQAFAVWSKTHPDAWMYAHTEAQPAPGHGLDLDRLANCVGIPEGRLRFSPPDGFKIGMPQGLVATLYQAFDVLLNPSMGEGFGIPILEAQACGVPVITSNHSAMPELTHAGWLVDGDPWWDEAQASFFHAPHIQSIIAALEQAYEARGDQELRDAAVNFAGRYDADLVTETHWKPTLDALTAPRSPSKPIEKGRSRADRRRAEIAARKTTPMKGVTHA